MSTQRSIRLCAIALCAMLLVSSERAAAATSQITLPSSGGTFVIGVFNGDSAGIVRAMFQPAGSSSCLFWQLGTSGKLANDLLVTGTSGPDTMEVFDVPGQLSNTHCGHKLVSFNRNGHFITFNGAAGNDFLKDADWMLGGPGRDTLVTEGFSLASTGLAQLEGGDNNDVLLSETRSGAVMFGDAGDDNLCVQSGITADTVDGDSGSNKLFGSANHKANVTTITSLQECLTFQ